MSLNDRWSDMTMQKLFCNEPKLRKIRVPTLAVTSNHYNLAVQATVEDDMVAPPKTHWKSKKSLNWLLQRSCTSNRNDVSLLPLFVSARISTAARFIPPQLCIVPFHCMQLANTSSNTKASFWFATQGLQRRLKLNTTTKRSHRTTNHYIDVDEYLSSNVPSN